MEITELGTAINSTTRGFLVIEKEFSQTVILDKKTGFFFFEKTALEKLINDKAYIENLVFSIIELEISVQTECEIKYSIQKDDRFLGAISKWARCIFEANGFARHHITSFEKRWAEIFKEVY